MIADNILFPTVVLRMFLWNRDCKKRKSSYENGLTTGGSYFKTRLIYFTAFSAVKGIVLATAFFYFF
jgi:hypothetical protein